LGIRPCISVPKFGWDKECKDNFATVRKTITDTNLETRVLFFSRFADLNRSKGINLKADL